VSLKPFQTVLTKDTLYAVVAQGRTDQLKPSIEVKGGTATLYTSQALPESDPLTDDMVADSTTLEGFMAMLCVPNYILITGAATSIVVSGLRVEEVV